MRIAYDHQIFSAQSYGGISRYFIEMAERTARIPGTEVSIISPVHVNSYLSSNEGSVQVIGKRVPKIRYTSRIRQTINSGLVRWALAHINPDLVHETYYAPRRVAPPKARIVLTVFDMIHELFPECFPASDLTRRNKVRAVRRADHVICISEQTRADLVSLLDIDPDKTTVIHLGFSLQAAPSDAAPRCHHPFLLYVGNRNAYKNFSALVRAYASHPTMSREFDIIAFGGGPFGAQERLLLQELRIAVGRVKQLSGDDKVLADLYKQASVLVYPSLYEGFGIPPLEAMSFGCPVVCSNSSSLPEVVGDAAETFDPTSVEALGAAIERVLNDAMLRGTLVQRGHDRVKLFSWQRCAEHTAEVYRRLLA